MPQIAIPQTTEADLPAGIPAPERAPAPGAWPLRDPIAPGNAAPAILIRPLRPDPCLPERILIVSDAWAPQVNGVVRTYEGIIGVLRAQGRRVEVIGPAEFPTLPLPGYAEIPVALAPARRLARMIDAFAPQAVHIPVEGPLGWAARRHCRRRGLAFSTSYHTNFPAYAAVRAPRRLAGPVERAAVALSRRFHAAARHTYVATASIEAQLRDWGFAGTLVRLTRGVDCDLFTPGPERPRADAPVLLYVGRVAPEKNLEGFLELTEAQIGAVRKVVVGDGPQLAALRRRHPEVEFRGTLTGAALADAYRDADVFVFPSRTDTFGMVLTEAMAAGLPIAAHDAPGPRDIVTGPELGAIDDDLGRAIRRALDAPGTRAGRHAQARARFDWEAVAARFLTHSGQLRG